MKYSYEYKIECVDLYRQDEWPKTSDGLNQKRFHDKICEWVRIEEAQGLEALRHKAQNKIWSSDEKYELISKVLVGSSVTETAISVGISSGLLYQWVRGYKIKGYEGPVTQRKGRPPKEPEKKIVPAELTPSESEEMIRLRAENEYLRAEKEVIKNRLESREM